MEKTKIFCTDTLMTEKDYAEFITEELRKRGIDYYTPFNLIGNNPDEDEIISNPYFLGKYLLKDWEGIEHSISILDNHRVEKYETEKYEYYGIIYQIYDKTDNSRPRLQNTLYLKIPSSPIPILHKVITESMISDDIEENMFRIRPFLLNFSCNYTVFDISEEEYEKRIDKKNEKQILSYGI